MASDGDRKSVSFFSAALDELCRFMDGFFIGYTRLHRIGFGEM